MHIRKPQQSKNFHKHRRLSRVSPSGKNTRAVQQCTDIVNTGFSVLHFVLAYGVNGASETDTAHTAVDVQGH